MKKIFWYAFDIQRFSGEGESGESNQTGENSADAEQSSTRDLSQEFSNLINGEFKDEFTKRTQAIINKRFKETKELEKYKNTVSPIMERLMAEYELSPGEENNLSDVLFRDDSFDEDISENESPDESGNYEEDNHISSSTHQDVLREKISMWLKESEAIKESVPEFDLRTQLRENKLFSKLLLSGVPLKTAYETVHKDEILRDAVNYTADTVRQQVVKNIEAKGRRPMENGISSQSGILSSVDVNSLTSQDILKILKQVENGASIKF